MVMTFGTAARAGIGLLTSKVLKAMSSRSTTTHILKGAARDIRIISPEETMLRKKGIDYSEKIAPFTGPPGRILDIGAAAGCILKGFEDAGWQGIGLEPNESMARAGRNRFVLDVRNGTLEEFESEEMFDLISVIQVAAHFVDPRKAFENVYSLLKPGGHLLVETWNRDSKTARFLGKKWHKYSPPSVVHWWSRDALTNFLKGLGFESVAGGRPTKEISGEHARSLLEYKLGKTFLLKLIPKRLNFPYPSEDLFWTLFKRGKNSGDR